MKSENQMAMECTITRDILNEMFNRLDDNGKALIQTDEPEDEPIEDMTIDEMREEIKYLREYKLNRAKTNNLMYACSLTPQEQVDAVINVAKSFFDIIVTKNGKMAVLSGISSLVNRYRKK